MLSVVTPSPILYTTPVPSWPMTRPVGGRGHVDLVAPPRVQVGATYARLGHLQYNGTRLGVWEIVLTYLKGLSVFCAHHHSSSFSQDTPPLWLIAGARAPWVELYPRVLGFERGVLNPAGMPCLDSGGRISETTRSCRLPLNYL